MKMNPFATTAWEYGPRGVTKFFRAGMCFKDSAGGWAASLRVLACAGPSPGGGSGLPPEPPPIAVISVAVFFLVWYYAAFVYSRRVAARVAREFKDAVLALGGTSKIRWFGTTAFRMTTEAASPPFKEAVVTVTLRPREMPINWAIATAQGRRDAALVEASLRS